MDFDFTRVSGLKFSPAKSGSLLYSLYNTTVGFVVSLGIILKEIFFYKYVEYTW